LLLPTCGTISMDAKVVKILYIDEDLDERGSASHLERITRHLSLTCIFTVMQNSISALESMEFVAYDICFIADNLHNTCSMSAIEFLRIVKIIGCSMPVILLTNSNSNMNQEGLPAMGFHPANIESLNFSSILSRPYTRSEICMMICHAFSSPSSTDENLHTNVNALTPSTSSKMQMQVSPMYFSPIRTDTSVGSTLLRESSYQAPMLSNSYWGLQDLNMIERNHALSHAGTMYDQNNLGAAAMRGGYGFMRKDFTEYAQTEYTHPQSGCVPWQRRNDPDII